MMIRRIFAGSIVALLLSASSLAAACDLSCAFASMSSDCHSEQAERQDSASGGMDMTGMSMAGMPMPGMAGGEGQPADSMAARAKTSHASNGEMGLCKRQSCDSSSSISATANRSVNSRFHTVLAIAGTPRVDVASLFFHDARDEIAHYRPLEASPLHVSLRI
jgi:hypothetical protein